MSLQILKNILKNVIYAGFKDARSVYRYTLMVDQKVCTMLSIQNELTLQKDFVANNII